MFCKITENMVTEEKRRGCMTVKEEERLYAQELFKEKENQIEFLKDRPVKFLTDGQKLKLCKTLDKIWLDIPLLDGKYEEVYIACKSVILSAVFDRLGMAGKTAKESANRSCHWDCIMSEIKMW